jgi:SAM-dependent methyltransferase
MALNDVSWRPSRTPPDAATRAFLDDAARRIDDFFEARWQEPIVGFVPSDFGKLWPALAAIREQELAEGGRFCEWGCGFGVVAGLAAKLGWDAHGIEIEPDLVAQARLLLAAHQLAAKLVIGSFIPPGGEHLAQIRAEMAWLISDGPDGHALLQREPTDWDVVFAYPWPGEEHVIERLFDRYARPGALLITWRTEKGARVQRKR